ncbi:MAG: hypothetical protein HY899_07420 [Deltaproteobacteria bacterium]|nr:hypothetical protein [Deltaproteobacteria bacterium]
MPGARPGAARYDGDGIDTALKSGVVDDAEDPTMADTLRTTRLHLFLGALLALVSGACAERAAADEAAPVLVRDLGRYALFGRAGIEWAGAASMPARGAVGASTGVLAITAPTTADGAESYLAAPSVTAVAGSSLHFVFADSTSIDAEVLLGHPVAPLEGALVSDVDWPSPATIECGGEDVAVTAANSPYALTPGRYRVVDVAHDQTLTLAPGGRYELCSLRLHPSASVQVHADNVVVLRDFMATSVRAQITGEGACAARWIAFGVTPSPAPNAAAFEFGQGTGASARARIAGQFFTPGRIVMSQHNDYVGRFWGGEILGSGAQTVTRTLADCDAPLCGDGVVDPGEQCDDGNNRNGDCCSSFCEVLPAGNACDDGLFCTRTDRCEEGGRCTGSGDPCRGSDGDGDCSESCDEGNDSCAGRDPDGSACDDGLYCNGADLCASGACASHGGDPCPGADADADCTESCEESTDTCTALDPPGAACDDGKFCTRVDACTQAGACQGAGTPCPGADGDGDCAESCDELADACSAFDTFGSGCDDGLFCTDDDSCDGHGRCAGQGDPCASRYGDGDADCSEACNEEEDACSAAEVDGGSCDDGLACTVGDRCRGGACAPSGQTSCDDGDPCTDSFCAPDGECLLSFNRAPCDDGNACTLGDRCDRGLCRGQTGVDCRDEDLCSTDLCDPADGQCRHVYAPAADCHDIGTASTRVEAVYLPEDGAAAERLITAWRSERDLDLTSREELGDPGAGDALALCLYDESDGVPELTYRLDLDAASLDGSAWKRRWSASRLVYKLNAPAGTAQGVSQVKLVVDRDFSAVFKLKAGANVGCGGVCRDKFDPPTPLQDGRYFAMEPAMTVQWVSSTGSCWTSRFEHAAANGDGRFYAILRRR